MFKFVVTKNVKELFHRAVMQNDIGRVKLLLEQASQDPKFHVDTLNDDGLTALQFSCFAGNIDLVKLLVSYGANVKIKDCDGWSLLHGAALGGKLDIARFLIEKGCRCSSRTDKGELPIDLASDLAITVLLLKTMLEQGQTLEVQRYMQQNPKIKYKIASEIETAIKMEHYETQLMRSRPYTNHMSHRKKLGNGRQSNAFSVPAGPFAGKGKPGIDQVRNTSKKGGGGLPQGQLVRSSSTEDLVRGAISVEEQVDRLDSKQKNTLKALTGTSYSYSPYNSRDYGENFDHIKHRSKSASSESNSNYAEVTSLIHSGTQGHTRTRISRQESDISSVSSRSETSESQGPKRSNPEYASIDSSSRRSRSGDSDSSSQSDRSRTKKTNRRSKSRGVYHPAHQGDEYSRRDNSDTKLYEKIKDKSKFNSKETYCNEREERGGNRPTGRSESMGSDRSSTSSRGSVETEPLYENIPNDVLLSIILRNRINDIYKTSSCSSEQHEPTMNVETHPEPIYENVQSFRDLKRYVTVDDNTREKISYPVQNGASVEPNPDEVYDDYLLQNGERERRGYVELQDKGNKFWDLDVDSVSSDTNSTSGAQQLPYQEASDSRDTARLNDIDRSKNYAPIYENLPRTSLSIDDDVAGTNKELHDHIRRQLHKRGPSSVSAGTLPNEYFGKDRASPVEFHDDTCIGKHTDDYMGNAGYEPREEAEENSNRGLRAFRLVKVEYPEVFV